MRPRRRLSNVVAKVAADLFASASSSVGITHSQPLANSLTTFCCTFDERPRDGALSGRFSKKLRNLRSASSWICVIATFMNSAPVAAAILSLKMTSVSPPLRCFSRLVWQPWIGAWRLGGGDVRLLQPLVDILEVDVRIWRHCVKTIRDDVRIPLLSQHRFPLGLLGFGRLGLFFSPRFPRAPDAPRGLRLVGGEVLEGSVQSLCLGGGGPRGTGGRNAVKRNGLLETRHEAL